MSKNKYCRLWCLIDGETKPFSVLAGFNYDMDELMRAIQQEKCVLRDSDTSDLALWKVRIS
jgi:hypothetical protein